MLNRIKSLVTVKSLSVFDRITILVAIAGTIALIISTS